MSDEFAVEFTDNAAVTDPQPAETSADADETSGRRGRPRDPGVIERDERVLGALSPGEAKTKAQLAGELSLAPSVVYLSLWRLHRAGLVEREQRTWRQTAPAGV
jgi:predicted Rossmann fold nucleotide-binding protein DprA/Smf involved in DNA uptake